MELYTDEIQDILNEGAYVFVCGFLKSPLAKRAKVNLKPKMISKKEYDKDFKYNRWRYSFFTTSKECESFYDNLLATYLSSVELAVEKEKIKIQSKMFCYK